MPSPNVSRAPDPAAPARLLAVSFAFPPLAYPRSIQVARLLKYARLRTVLVCADERGARRDPTLEPDAEARLDGLLRVPFHLTRARRYANAAAHRFHRPLWNRWNRRPDEYVSWTAAALRAVEGHFKQGGQRPDALATFSQPVVDHLIGLELKDRLRVPWVASFSDPWVDNPFQQSDAATRDFNLALERGVVESADRLVFTSRETIEMVMSKYPAPWKAKARVMPQCFDPALFPAPAPRAGDDQLVVRYVGNFYGGRTPAPLVRALEALHASEPAALRGVTFELVGVTDDSKVKEAGLSGLPEGMIRTAPPVEYRESLRLMSEADGLLIIDAPAELSVFLPSKLIDYVGAGRPVMGLTPPGAASSLIKELGGWVSDPSDAAAGARTLRDFLDYLRRREREGGRPWGDPRVRVRYEATQLAGEFEELVLGMLA